MSINIKFIGIWLSLMGAFSCRHQTEEIKPDEVVVASPHSVSPVECRPLRDSGFSSPTLLPNPYNVEKYRTGDLRDFSFSSTALIDVLEAISRSFSVPLILDPESAVGGDFSGILIQTSFLDALEVVLQTTKLSYAYNGRYFYIGQYDRAAPESVNKLGIHHQYKSRNVQSEMLASMLTPAYKDYIKPSKELDLITVFGPIEIVRKITDELIELDTSSEQVLLKLNIIEVERSQLSKFGHYLNSMSNVGGALNSLAPVVPVPGSTVLNTATAVQFFSTVDILSGSGRAKIMASPKIITRNGENAEFKSLISAYISGATLSSGSNTSKTVTRIDSGLEFVITPYLKSRETIILDIAKAKIGSIDIDELSVPRVKEYSLKTKVSVTPGETILIGGMIGSKNKEYTYGVPYLMDIPYVGWLFKSKRQESQDVEVFFTVTPEIVCQ